MLDQNSECRYPSKERVIRNDVLIYAEGDDLVNDLEEAVRQGYNVEEAGAERIERDGVLIAAGTGGKKAAAPKAPPPDVE